MLIFLCLYLCIEQMECALILRRLTVIERAQLCQNECMEERSWRLYERTKVGRLTTETESELTCDKGIEKSVEKKCSGSVLLAA